MSTEIETLEFQAEATQLLRLMVHSIYSSKDIFLRELISNASDALDRLRLASLIDKDLQVDTSNLHIMIESDRQRRVLIVRDNGIGMSRDEVVALIGTIAKSGTADLLRQLTESKDASAARDLIGQFGVGFYSTFMVADRVTLVTRRAGEPGGTRWESTGDGTYTIESVDDASHGTTVSLHLKPRNDEDRLLDYADEWTIRGIVKRYSDFIAWPIRMEIRRDGEEGEDPPEIATLNSMKALWARPRSEVDDNEYKEFYKHVTHDWTDPLEVLQLKAEGTFEYEALLFIPSIAPYDLFQPGTRHGLQLYVRRVFIMDDCLELMPHYLRFVRGVVDARDLSLNISREILQQDRQIQLMRRRLVKKVLATLNALMTQDADRYATFWREFGRAVKEGLLSDLDNQRAILDISMFATTHDPQQLTTLGQYVQRMKSGRQEIYFVAGESRELIENSPHIEALRDQGYEVLLLTDPIDQLWVNEIGDIDGNRLQSIVHGQVDLAHADSKTDGEPDRDAQNEQFEPLLVWLTDTLKTHVKKVRLSSRLTTSPCCLVGDAQDMTPALEKIYRALGQDGPPVKRILELNPTHPLITGLRDSHKQRPDDPTLPETAELLYGTALLAEGATLSDPARFARILAERLTRTL